MIDTFEINRKSLSRWVWHGAITALEEHGLIEPAGHDDRRRPYRLTAAGQAELASAVRSLGAIAAEGARRLGISLHARGPGWAQ